MKATYVGDPRNGGEGPETIEQNGVTFTKGKAVNVSDDVAKKLAGNFHFTVGREQAEPPTAEGETTLGSVTGDPETATLVANDGPHAASEPMQDPRSGSQTAGVAAQSGTADAEANKQTRKR